MKEKRKSGFWIAFAATALLFAAILELSKNTLSGWLLSAAVFCLFAFAHQRVLRQRGGGLRFAAWLAFFVLLAAVLKFTEPPARCLPAVSVADPELTGTVTVAQGELRGVYNEDKSVEVYAGIPYAKPPVGELRWVEPQEPEPWEGVRLCDRFAPMSMQKRNPVIVDSLTRLIGYHDYRVSLRDNYREAVSEDSLYLNIWKPAGAAEGLPVLVYIHGGSLMTGQSYYADYNGESLAAQGIIVVNFAYRLNVFGYYANEELAAESPHGTTGNYGLLDQVAALRWVHENIAAFGGDPDNVTLAGESAGASSVNALCVSPLTEGLFRRAIAESSGITPVQPFHTFRSLEEALDMGREILAEFGAADMAALREIPAERLVGTAYQNDAMTVDGYALVEEPYRSYERGANHEEALLNGFNGREADVFNLTLRVTAESYPELLEELLGPYGPKAEALYPAATDREAKRSSNAVLSAAWFAYSHYDWSRYLTEQGRPAYAYCFTKHNGGISDWHSGELIYAFGNLALAPRLYDETDEALSALMQAYWLNFIKTGDPNGPGLPRWPTTAEAPGQVLRLDAESGMTEDPYLALYPVIDGFQNSCRPD